jgi:hypothetical protein
MFRPYTGRGPRNFLKVISVLVKFRSALLARVRNVALGPFFLIGFEHPLTVTVGGFREETTAAIPPETATIITQTDDPVHSRALSRI